MISDPRDKPNPAHQSLPSSPSLRPGPRLEERSHDRIRPDRLSGSFELRLITVDPLHIGSGAPVVLDGEGGKEIVRAFIMLKQGEDGLSPVIPGSSLKGAVRSLAEALCGGCEMLEPCRPTCFACALFGHADSSGASFASRVGFTDALPEDIDTALDKLGISYLPVAYEPRQKSGRRIYRHPKVFPAGDVPYEVVQRGVAFLGRLQVINVLEEELGLVLLCLGLDSSFHLRLGGGKFSGLGRVRCEISSASLRRGYADPAPQTLKGNALEGRLRQALSTFQPDAHGRHILNLIRETLGAAK